MPFRSLLPAACLALLAAAPARADLITVHLADAPDGVEICALVMQAPGEAADARAMIEAQRPALSDGVARFDAPRDDNGRNLYFEGRVRLVAAAPGHCPVGCDLDIFWSHPPETGTAIAEQACSFDLGTASADSPACREGETSVRPYDDAASYRPAPGEDLLAIADIDGEVEYFLGDTAIHPLLCAGQ